MSNVVPFPNSTTEADPITALRKAIAACIQSKGRQTTALVIAQAFEIPDFSGWRDQARKMFSSKGDK